MRWGKKTCRQAKYFRQALTGFERPISCLQNRHINHYATEPHMSSRTTQNFITTNWQINEHQHTSKHVRFRERKKFKVQIDQSADVYIFAPVRKSRINFHDTQNAIFHKKGAFTTMPKGLIRIPWTSNKNWKPLTHISTHQGTSICKESSISQKNHSSLQRICRNGAPIYFLAEL